MTGKNQEGSTKVMPWAQAISVYFRPQVLTMLFLGFAAGLPFLLVFSTLTFWLAELDIQKATIGYFSWIGITYSIKVFWAPVVDRVSLPKLTNALGKRRSWMLLAQFGIGVGLVGMAVTDPAADIEQVAFFALVVAFFSATQDITIDAYRIEAADIQYQGAMAATYQLGYRIAMIVAGAGALYLAEFWTWPVAYMVMAACVLIGFVTVLVVKEPDHADIPIVQLNDTAIQQQVSRNFVAIGLLIMVMATIGVFWSSHYLLRSVFAVLIVLSLFLLGVSVSARNGRAPTLVGWFYTSVIQPFIDFFTRFGVMAIVILVFVGVFRLSDISMGSMANVLYVDLGYTKTEIANVAKVYGVILSMLGAFFGGVLVARYGVSRPLVLAALLVSLTNLVFAWLATVDTEIQNLMAAISADNFSAGLAGSIFIAYLSSLVNKAYTATQYALFSSLFTLPGKIVAGFSGVIVESYGFVLFFIYVALLGLPAIMLALFFAKSTSFQDIVERGNAPEKNKRMSD